MSRRVKIALALLLVTLAVMGYYALHLKRQAETLTAQPVDTRPITPPVEGPSQRITLYVADDADGMLHKQETEISVPSDPNERARQILRALFSVYLAKDSTHPLGSGADVKYVFLVKPDVAIVDTNAAFAENHRSGILVEQLTLASIARTLAANLPGTIRVKILVEGKERETLAGHADLADFYNTAAGDPFPVAAGQ
ncbi:MAG TPA: GerMN domain-containing protein [Alphaproteobacteria bacterium]|nr:GerMN domain-containing protein [Alphaproteobacteria bacterium]